MLALMKHCCLWMMYAFVVYHSQLHGFIELDKDEKCHRAACVDWQITPIILDIFPGDGLG